MGYKHLMLVEGKDDQHVFGHLLDHHRIDCERARKLERPDLDAIFIAEMGGVDSLLQEISIRLDDGDLERLAIVVDADTDLQSRWEALRSKLQQSGDITLPEQPQLNGTVTALTQPLHEVRIGIWLMPNNRTSGILEHFLQFLVPKGDNLMEHAKESVRRIPSTERLFPESRRGKAEIHTWLAWQEEPGKPLGLSIACRYLDVEAEHSRKFVSWVKRVFELSN